MRFCNDIHSSYEYVALNSDVIVGTISVASSGIDPQGDGSLNEGDSEDFKCSSSSSSNPPSTITWYITYGENGTDDLTNGADQTITHGEHNGYDVHSILAITVSRNMNGQHLTCNLMYNDKAEHSHSYYLDILCKYELVIKIFITIT